ncbi:N-formylglutamate amidohydrolase [Psychroserpens burtonensis]|uniref:N-formylglutamate amidohydrolase n=1 Tax=Psychroserpens burtonensis TaxID=49278 RepID=A0A5C7B7N6_9FLAO|nr:N-formylglutamate amidohydrolase [Psychroserpens burtonensis]TXE16171.1 N-formylglutamate amidohydrolase [Psychroserpens burtonensis]
MKLILTCEHGGNKIPNEYVYLFQENQEVLETHRGFDLGALDTFDYLKSLSDYSKASTTSRLLIELNRSLHHSQLFSEYSNKLSVIQKNQITSTYYHPYRNEVSSIISNFISKDDTVLHLSIHSFTPSLKNTKRECDIGLLYDPRKPSEKLFAALLKAKIKAKNHNLKVRFNYPYLGKSDGFTTYLRRQFKMNYTGIEIEINQKYSKDNQMNLLIKDRVLAAIKEII